VLVYDARKVESSLQNEANLIKQKCMTQETATHNIKKQWIGKFGA